MLVFLLHQILSSRMENLTLEKVVVLTPTKMTNAHQISSMLLVDRASSHTAVI
jgi:hypothetical protein